MSVRFANGAKFARRSLSLNLEKVVATNYCPEVSNVILKLYNSVDT